MSIPMFEFLVVETHSYCNRRCRTCIRQNDPAKSRFKNGEPIRKFMDSDTVYSILDQAACNIGFRGDVCLWYFNEPLIDHRIPEFAKYAKNMGFKVQVTTNGDYLTRELAEKLDGVLDQLFVSVYNRKTLESKRAQYQRLFRKTKVTCAGLHVITHFSPHTGLANLIEAHKNRPCPSALRHFIIDYKGEMMMCCEDLSGNFKLGNVHDTPLEELWFGQKHSKIVSDLQKPNGRLAYPYCATCPIYITVRKPRVEVQHSTTP